MAESWSGVTLQAEWITRRPNIAVGWSGSHRWPRSVVCFSATTAPSSTVRSRPIEDHFEHRRAQLGRRGRCGAARRRPRRRGRGTARGQDRPARGDEDRRAAVPDQRHRHGSGGPTSEMFGLFRVIGGIGVGVASVIAPAYIAETSPPRIRGRLGSLQQLAIVTGIFVSLLIDYAAGAPRGRGSARSCGWGWRPGGGCSSSMAVPAVVYGVLAFTIPESPRYLVATYRIPEARKVLATLLGEKNLELTITRIQEIAGVREAAVVARSAQARPAGSTESSGSASACRSSSSSSAST